MIPVRQFPVSRQARPKASISSAEPCHLGSSQSSLARHASRSSPLAFMARSNQSSIVARSPTVALVDLHQEARRRPHTRPQFPGVAQRLLRDGQTLLELREAPGRNRMSIGVRARFPAVVQPEIAAINQPDDLRLIDLRQAGVDPRVDVLRGDAQGAVASGQVDRGLDPVRLPGSLRSSLAALSPTRPSAASKSCSASFRAASSGLPAATALLA